MRTDDIKNAIFVFGSNEKGIHGAGAARTALDKYGAIWGVGYGHRGRSFAIPTKGNKLITTRVPAADGKTSGYVVGDTLPLAQIAAYVDTFIAYAYSHPTLEFQVTRIGCGLAGLKDSDVAPMFEDAPSNCYFDTVWERYLGRKREFWGTF